MDSQADDLLTDSDVFRIELYGFHSDFDERLAYNLLEAAFEVFPDLHYCILSLPSSARYFPLLNNLMVINKYVV